MLSEQQKLTFARRLRKARDDLMHTSPFFSVLLSYMKLSLDENCDTAYTDGVKIAFSTDFAENLNDRELQFILCHEVMHVALHHLTRPGAAFKSTILWNIATDIVVNSNIGASFGMDFISLKSQGVSMHLAPDGKEGYCYTAEDIYEMFINKAINVPDTGDGMDDHNHWQDSNANDEDDEIWCERIVQAARIARGMSQLAGSETVLPPAVERLEQALCHSQTDWRTLLNNYIQEDVCDYSFNPPDRRFQGEIILPDFNDKDEKVENILFMVDTSGSISNAMLKSAYSEIRGAIEQFDGNLEGKIGFFDTRVQPAVPFSSVDDVLKLKPRGGGGTSFSNVFQYLNNVYCKENEEPATIIILTDGYSDYPAECEAHGIPVVWLLCNNNVTPPWGTVARISLEKHA